MRREFLQFAALAVAVTEPLFAQTLARPAATPEQSWQEYFRQGETILHDGEIRGDAGLLLQAITILRDKALPLTSRTTDNNDNWVRTRARIGRATLCIGALTHNAKYYTEAASIFRSVLAVRARSSSPNAWADDQNNLGGALLGLSKTTSNGPLLKEAEAAFASALEIYSSQKSPKLWADAQTNLGITHFLIGQSTGNTAYYARARDELASAQPHLAKPAADSVASLLKVIEQRILKG